MLGNYLLVAARNLRKNAFFSAINIAGLAAGLAVCLLITVFVADELSYDRYNEKANRIYRLNSDSRVNGSVFHSADVAPVVGPTLAKNFPQLEATVRLLNNEDVTVHKGNESVNEPHATYADSTFFTVFTLPLLSGDPATALTAPHTAVLSETTARKYFNTADAVGKTLLLNNNEAYTVTAVMKDMPARSHIHFNIIRSLSTLDYSRSDNWLGNVDFVTYVLTKPGVPESQLAAMLSKTTQRYLAPLVQSMMHTSLQDMAARGDYIRYTFFPLTSIHLYANLKDEMEPNGNIQYVYIFSVAAALVLLLACINFINLSIARSARRAKEVGVRKVLGASRKGLAAQFLTESILTAGISVTLAVLFAMLLLPWFNSLSGKDIQPAFFLGKWIMPVLLCTALVVGFLAGSYPALLLSSFKPVRVLKGALASGFKTGWLKNGLVTFQFFTAILLVTGTIVIYTQLNYIRNKNIGYNRSQVLVLPNTLSLGSHARAFRDAMLRMPGVLNGTMTRNLPTSGYNNVQSFFKDASFSAGQSVTMGSWVADENYLPTFQMQLAKGRNFSTGFATDSSGVIINEKAASLLGYKDPLNQPLYQFLNNQVVKYRIIGVVKDFNFNSLRQEVGPICLLLNEQRGSMAFRINSTDIPALVRKAAQLYQSYNKEGIAFVYSFMDKDFNRLYQAEQRTGSIFICFAAFAVFIACLGLFGLVAYAAEQRTREIGIRKVLGAGTRSIVQLLSADFLRLVALAALVAFPVGWWLMHNWLNGFAYRTAIQWWMFALAGLLALVVALCTVAIHALRAAHANPVKSLRTE